MSDVLQVVDEARLIVAFHDLHHITERLVAISLFAQEVSSLTALAFHDALGIVDGLAQCIDTSQMEMLKIWHQLVEFGQIILYFF